MNKIITLLFLALITSCSDDNLIFIEQEIIDGKVSAISNGSHGGPSLPEMLPKIWVQTPTQTREVEIPFAYENKWKVGDSCLLIIEKYKEVENE
jgi:hypothetical protein